MEVKFYVDIKDDYGKVRTFEVPTLKMKIAIDNIDKELKKSYKHDALKNAVPFSVFPNGFAAVVVFFHSGRHYLIID